MIKLSANMVSFSRIDKILEKEPDPAFVRRAKIIFQNLDLSGKEKVLDVGCGRGFYLRVLKSFWPKIEVYGVDLNNKYLSQARKTTSDLKVHLVKGDATKLPFKNSFFDRVIASEILEHIKDDQKAILEIYRVLKPGGIVMITVPNKNYPLLWDPLNWFLGKTFKTHVPKNIWWLAGIWADHERLYTEKQLILKIKKTGFKIEKTWSSTHSCLPFTHFILYGIGKNLVEKGFLKSFNRFDKKEGQAMLNKILLLPIKVVDGLNKRERNFETSVNIIMKAKKG